MGVKSSYVYIENIITQGFLSLGLLYNDNFLVFKTLTEKEYRNLKYLCSNKDSASERMYRLALSTFMVNGDNMLVDRNSKINELKSFYGSLPLEAVNRIVTEVTNLHTRYIKSLKYFEGFCYTDKSRYLWKILNNGNPTSTEFSGIEGTKNCGMNLVQENWININNRLDEEEEYDKDLNLSLMVSSSMNPKGSKSVSISHKTNKDELASVRSQIAHYGYDKKRYIEERKSSKWAKPIITKEDLVRELEKQVKGEKDYHDLFIEKWITEQKRLADKAKNSLLEKQAEYRRKQEDIDTSSVESSRIVSAEEMKDIDQRKYTKMVNTGDSLLNYESKQAYIKKISSVILKNEDRS
jgi:hypothetical protein